MSGEEPHRENSTEQSSITRRNMLGAVGGAVGTTFGVGFVRSASATTSEVTKVRNSTPIQKLWSAVGKPEIVDYDVKVYEGGEYSTRITNFETTVGTLSHHEALSSDTDRIETGETSATFDIQTLGRSDRSELPERFADVPLGVRFSLKYENGGTLLTTSVTEDERTQIERVVPEEVSYALHIRGDSAFYYVETTEGKTYRITSQHARPRIEDPSLEPVVTTQINADACFDCGTNTPFCIPRCAPKCNPLSGDALQCGACVVDHCADLDVVSCAKCIASLPEDI